MKEQNKKVNRNDAVGLGIVFGSAIGAGLGIATGTNIALSAGIGISLGIVLGAIIAGYSKKKMSSDSFKHK